MRLNTRSLSALEAGIDSSCNDKIQYSGKHADAISFVVRCLYYTGGEEAPLDWGVEN